MLTEKDLLNKDWWHYQESSGTKYVLQESVFGRIKAFLSAHAVIPNGFIVETNTLDMETWVEIPESQWRIVPPKPKEPIYEWRYTHDNGHGVPITSDKYYTDEEYEKYVDDKEHCIKLPWTKQERK